MNFPGQSQQKPGQSHGFQAKPGLHITTTYKQWCDEVNERDQTLRDEETHMELQISEARRERRSLIQRMGIAPTGNGTPPQRNTNNQGCDRQAENHTGTATSSHATQIPMLTDTKRTLLNNHEGCTRCRRFYAGHRSHDCPMTLNNTWPDPAKYKTLTPAMAEAAKRPRVVAAFAPLTGEESDDYNSYNEDDYDDDTYVPCTTPPSPSFTEPHLFITVEVTGPATLEFPLSVKALPDIGCPSTVISCQLATELGLRRYPLPSREDNLLSLSGEALGAKEYVKLRVSVGKGSWRSKTFRAKVHKDLPIPIILGIPFLSSERLVIDAEQRTVTVKDTGIDLANPETPEREWAPECVTPPPTPPKPKPPPAKRQIFCRIQISRKLLVAVQTRIETLTFEDKLRRRDRELKREYVDCFPKGLPDVNRMLTHIYHRIRLKDPNLVVKGRGYSAPKKLHEPWKKLLDEHLAAGRIRPSSSEHASPSFVIPKNRNGVPDLTLPPRWVNDYRKLNKNTVRDNGPLPRINEILADCGKGKVFGKIDMTNSFFQTRVHPDDIHLIAVRTPWGLYEWVVMPMGGCNAPSTHQRRMTDALRPLIGLICHVYLDDIIIWAETVEEHEKNMHAVLDALRKANLYCNIDKTNLFSSSIEFLRHLVSKDGIQADPRKVEGVVNWPTPTTVTNVQGFIGLARYLAPFLSGLAEHTSVLTPLTTDEAERSFPAWTDDHQKAFVAIKKLVTGTECLTVIDYDDPKWKIFVTTDASNRRTGAVLSFGETWETARPVAYDSYQLNTAEKNYPTHEKELLAIIKALKKWRTYLIGTSFEVHTDHRTLEFFQTQKETSARQKR